MAHFCASVGYKISGTSAEAGVAVQMSLAYLQAMAAQDIIGRIVGVYLPSLAFEAIGKCSCLCTIRLSKSRHNFQTFHG